MRTRTTIYMKTIQSLQWMPLACYLYPLIAGFVVTSTSPTIFGRYSISLFALNLLSVCFYPLFYWFSKKQHLLGKCAVLVSMCFATVLALQNMQVLATPYIVLVWALVRLACGISLLTIGFQFLQIRGPRRGLLMLLVACLLIGFSTADVIVEGYAEIKAALARSNAGANAWLQANRAVKAEKARDRGLADNFLKLDEDYLVYRPIGPEDILIVGDSVLLGQNVDPSNSYRVRLEQILSGTGSPTKVHVLAMGGADFPQYLALIKLLPDGTQLDRIVLAVSITDLPIEAPKVPDEGKFPKPSRVHRIVADFVYRLGFGGYTLQLLHSAITPWFNNNGSNQEIDMSGNLSRLTSQLDPANSSFQTRFQFVRDYLSRFSKLAAKHSKNPPILLISPLMICYYDYPLEPVHALLRELADQAGFQPLDLLLIYKANHIDGVLDRSTGFRAGFGNRDGFWDYIHPNEKVHNLIAEQLALLLN